jgi:hypothetical protein
VDVAVAAQAETAGWSGPTPTQWELVWAKNGGEWQLRDIKPKKLPMSVDLGTIIGRWK